MRYRWEIKTSDTWYAGTDANVFLSLSGLNASMREVQISDPDDINDWEQGDINHGIIETEDLGELQTGTLRHDQSGPAAGWSVDWIRVTVEETGREWTATIGKFDEGGRFPLLRFSRTNEGSQNLRAKQAPGSISAEQAASFLKDVGWSPAEVERLVQGPQKGDTAKAAIEASTSTGIVHHFVTLLKQAVGTGSADSDEERGNAVDAQLALANRPAPAKTLEHHFVTLKKSKTTD